jgi:hypothetical protein
MWRCRCRESCDLPYSTHRIMVDLAKDAAGGTEKVFGVLWGMSAGGCPAVDALELALQRSCLAQSFVKDVSGWGQSDGVADEQGGLPVSSDCKG